MDAKTAKNTLKKSVATVESASMHALQFGDRDGSGRIVRIADRWKDWQLAGRRVEMFKDDFLPRVIRQEMQFGCIRTATLPHNHSVHIAFGSRFIHVRRMECRFESQRPVSLLKQERAWGLRRLFDGRFN